MVDQFSDGIKIHEKSTGSGSGLPDPCSGSASLLKGPRLCLNIQFFHWNFIWRLFMYMGIGKMLLNNFLTPSETPYCYTCCWCSGVNILRKKSNFFPHQNFFGRNSSMIFTIFSAKLVYFSWILEICSNFFHNWIFGRISSRTFCALKAKNIHPCWCCCISITIHRVWCPD